MAGSKPISGRTHTRATEQAATMAVSQAENTLPPQPPKGLQPSLGATAIISIARALSWGWHWQPASHTHPSRDAALSA